MKNSLSVLFISTLFLSAAVAQSNPEVQKINELFDVLESNNKVMGVVTISKDGKPIYNREIGYARISDDGRVKNTGETMFRVGSISKTFTAVVIFQLIEEGKLTLDTKLSKFFPQISNADKITIEQMLLHRSGIHNVSLDADYQVWKLKPHTKKEILERFSTYKPEFEPGEKEVYSNSAYVLLAYIIESVTGSTYNNQVERRIVKKIGLKNTRAGGVINRTKNEAISYGFADKKWNEIPQGNMSNFSGSGSIVSTASDINRFLAELFESRLISAKSLQTMTAPSVITGDDTVMGMGRLAFNNKTKVGFTQDGSVDGFGSIYFYVPADKLSIAITYNGQNYPFGDIFWSVLRAVYKAPVSIPSFKPFALTTEQISRFEGTYTLTAYDLTLTIRREGSRLTAQIKGDPAITLEAIGETKFQYEPDGVLVEFLSDESGEIKQVTTFKNRQKLSWARTK